MILWHYTTGEKFKQIVVSGFLLPATVGVPDHEKPILWFSKNQTWENTATKYILQAGKPVQLSLPDLYSRGQGLVRFGVKLKRKSKLLIAWPKVARKARMQQEQRRALEISGSRQGAYPKDWYGCFVPIAIEDIDEIHVAVFVDKTLTWEAVRGEA